MWTEFIQTLRRQRGSILGWGFCLFLYNLMMMSFYPSIGDMLGDLSTILQKYPPEMLAFFPNISEMYTAGGFMDTYFYSYMTLIIGIYAIGAFSGLLTHHEEQGILDLLLAQPVSRSQMFWGRVLGIVASIALILLISWLGWVIPAGKAGFELTWLQMLLPNFSLLGVLVLFGALGLLFSMLLPSTRLASSLSGALIVANFLMTGLSNLNPDLKEFYKLTPLYYYQGGMAVDGLNWGWFLGMMVISLLLALIGWQLFLHRDIRVGGERSFQLAALQIRRKTSAK